MFPEEIRNRKRVFRIHEKVTSLPSALIARYVKSLPGQRVYARFADSALAVYGMSFVVERAELDEGRQLFTLCPVGGKQWAFLYTEVILLTDGQLLLQQHGDAALRLEVAKDGP